MDLLDFLWNVSQERQIGELRGQLRQVRLDLIDHVLPLNSLAVW